MVQISLPNAKPQVKDIFKVIIQERGPRDEHYGHNRRNVSVNVVTQCEFNDFRAPIVNVGG
jgi:hypothetical protein